MLYKVIKYKSDKLCFAINVFSLINFYWQFKLTPIGEKFTQHLMVILDFDGGLNQILNFAIRLFGGRWKYIWFTTSL